MSNGVTGLRPVYIDIKYISFRMQHQPLCLKTYLKFTNDKLINVNSFFFKPSTSFDQIMHMDTHTQIYHKYQHFTRGGFSFGRTLCRLGIGVGLGGYSIWLTSVRRSWTFVHLHWCKRSLENFHFTKGLFLSVYS